MPNDGSNDDASIGQGAAKNLELWHELTGFQRDCLLAIAVLNGTRDGTPPDGRTIQEQLAEWKGERIPPGSLYQNLNALDEHGLICKKSLTGRRNGYCLSTQGSTLLWGFSQRVSELDPSAMAD